MKKFNKSLIEAAISGRAVDLKRAIDAGANPNFELENGQTIAHLAAINNNANIIKYLPTYGVDLNKLDNNGETPIYLAAKHGSYGAVRLLLFLSADPNITPGILHLDDPRPVKLLVRSGCDPNSPNSSGLAPLHIAAKNGNAELIRKLKLSGADINNNDNPLRVTPLHLAVQFSSITAVLELIKLGAYTREKDNNGKTPFDYARENRNYKILNIIENHRTNRKPVF